MPQPIDITQLESDVYRSRFDDGSIEIFLGVSLIWIGVAWLYLPTFSGLAGILPAVAVGPFVAWRTKFLEARVGYVRFGDARRQWERRNLLLILLSGIGLFAVGIGTYALIDSGDPKSDVLTSLAPGLIAFLLAAIVIGVATITSAWRLLTIAAVLIAGGIFVAAQDSNPGIPLIPAGAVAAAWGVSRFVRFVRDHPKAEMQ